MIIPNGPWFEAPVRSPWLRVLSRHRMRLVPLPTLRGPEASPAIRQVAGATVGAKGGGEVHAVITLAWPAGNMAWAG